MARRFHHFAGRAARLAGHWGAFIAACVILVGWAASGPLFGFSDTWQLVINTSTTIVTFLMVFLIQHSQNVEALAVHVKLDELILHAKEASNRVVDLEEAEPEVIERYRREQRRLAAEPEDAS